MSDKIKLKSKIMIEQYSGENEIEKDWVQDDFDFSYLDTSGLNEKEINDLEDDILNLIKLGGIQIKNIALPNGVKRIIPDILKEAYTYKIEFEGSEEYFEKMKQVPMKRIENSNYGKLEPLRKKEASEYDIFRAMKSKAKSYLESEGVEEYEYITKYLPDDVKIYVTIRDGEELKKVLNKKHQNNEFIIDKNDINNFKDIDEEIGICLKIENMSELSITELTKLKAIFNINEVNIFSEKEFYSSDIYLQLRKEIDEIIKDIDKGSTDIEKFVEIYKRLGHKIQYDHEDNEYVETDGVEGKRNYNAHNLIGALLENLSVCEGISKTLEQVLYCVGIEAKTISAAPIDKKEKCGHVWNRVKIDDTWYNVDLTYDLENIKDFTNMQYCLQSNEEFQHDQYIIKKDEQIMDTTYNQDQLFEKYFDYGDLVIENEDTLISSSSEIFDIIRNYKESTKGKSNKVKIEIIDIYDARKEGGALENAIYLSTIIDDEYEKKAIQPTILLENEENLQFAKDFFNFDEEFTSKKEKDGKTRYIREDGIELVLNEEIKTQIKELGFDIDEFLAKYEIENEEVEVLEKFDQQKEDIIQEPTAMIKYKENLATRIINKVKELYNKIKDRKSAKKEMKKSNFSEKTETGMKVKIELPSWDLNNWSQEELEQARIAARRLPENVEEIQKKSEKGIEK